MLCFTCLIGRAGQFLAATAAFAVAAVALSAAGASASAATVRAGGTAAQPAASTSGNLFAGVSEGGTLVSGTCRGPA